MTEATTQDIERALAEMTKIAGSLDGYIRTKGKVDAERARAAEELEKQTRGRMKKFDDSLRSSILGVENFSGSFEGAMQQLGNVAERAFAGAAVFSLLMQRGSALAKTYQSLTDYGQGFGGSMFNMMQTAAQAGLGLSEFAEIQKAHNVTIDATKGNYFAMNLQLRRNLAANGQYGMSISQLADFTAEYLETSRLNGSLGTRSTQQTVKDMGALALTTTALAKASDKTRQEITKLAGSAMQSALSIAQIASTPIEIRGMVSKQVKEASAAFAALPGEAGDFFVKFFNDTLGSTAALTAGGNTAIEAGMSGLASQMDAVAMKFRNGTGTIDDQMKMQNDFKKQVEDNLPVLKQQALAGNENAAQMIRMGAAMKYTTKAELEKAKADVARQSKLTAFFNSVESMFSDLKGIFVNGFLNSFNKAFKGFESLDAGGLFKKMSEFMKSFGERLGKFLGETLTAAKMDAIAQSVTDVAEGLFAFANWLVNSPIIGMMLGVFTGLATVGGLVVGAFEKLSSIADKFGINLGKVIGVMLGASVILKAFKSLAGKIVSTMTVKAGIVNVEGGSGGGGGGGGDGEGRGRGRGSRGRRTGWRGKLDSLTRRGRVGARMAGRSLGRSGGLLGRVAGVGGVAGRMGLGLLKGAGIGLLGMGAETVADNYLAKGGVAQKAVGTLGRAASYGATGAMLGSIIPGVGTLAGGLVGGGYGAISGMMDYGSRAPAGAKDAKMAAGATAAAAASIAASTDELKKAGAKDASAPTPATPAIDPMTQMLDAIKKQTEMMMSTASMLSNKIEAGNRILAKIEVSAQSL